MPGNSNGFEFGANPCGPDSQYPILYCIIVDDTGECTPVVPPPCPGQPSFSNGQTIALGTTNLNQLRSVEFTATNCELCWDEVLTLTIVGANSQYFGFNSALTQKNTTLTITPMQRNFFTVYFQSSVAGFFTGTIAINHSNRNPSFYTANPLQIFVTANIISSVAEARVSLSGLTIPNNSTGTSFGNTTTPTNLSRTFTIHNDGNANLTVGTVAASNTTDYSVTAQPSSPIAAGGSSTFSVQLSGASEGIKSTNISFTTNDPTDLTYSFGVSGSVLSASPTTSTILIMEI